MNDTAASPTPTGADVPILIVEDDAVQALDLRLQLQTLGYRVIGPAATADEALRVADREWPALALMDVRLQQGPDGVDLASLLNRRADLPVVFLTAYSDPETVRRAARIGAYGFVTKPYEERELRAAIEVALAKSALERRPAAEERWFAQSLRCAQDGVLLTDADARVRFLNPVAETWTGWSQPDAAGRSLAEVLALEPAEAEVTGDPAAVLGAAVRDGSVLAMLPAVAAVARDRTRRLLDVSCAPIGDEGGRRLGSIVQLRDAGARRAIEQRRVGGLQRFRVAFDRAPLGMALVATDGCLLEVNDALCTLLGRPREAMLGRRQVELTAPEDRDTEMRQLAILARGDRTIVQFERRCLHADGSPLWSLTSVSRVADPAAAGDADGALLLYQVVDFRPQREAAMALASVGAQQLQQQVDAAVERTTQALLSRASHELRTPLNAVLGFAQLLQSRPASELPERVQTYAGFIVEAGGRLLALVEDLLDLQRADDGTLPFEPAVLALRAEVVAALPPQPDAAGLARPAMRIDVPDDLRVLADPRRLRRVVAELAAHAARFAQPATTLRWAATADASRVRLTLDDPARPPLAGALAGDGGLFDPAGRDPAVTAGVGLALARRLAERMGGRLSIEGAAGSGTRALLELPAAR